MSDGAVFHAGWTLDDIDWSRFHASQVDADLLAAVKAASLVEFNAPDYVAYLKRVYADAPDATLASIERWGVEEVQHGRALARWAERADPSFNFESASARFRALYSPPHFAGSGGSVRGSRRGEMIARCVVESGTSSFYTAIREASSEPVLKDIAGHIAADEFRHYRLFYDILQAQSEPDLPLWRKIWVAVGRIGEADDDELPCAYYCANVPASEAAKTPYRRKLYAQLYNAKVVALYRRHHVDKLVKMVALPAGLNPGGRLSRLASALLWRVMRFRAGLASAPAPKPAS
jgi:hypothetical protein